MEYKLDRQRDYFAAGKTRSIESRLDHLKSLRKAIEENDEQLLTALKSDLGKSAFEAYATEIGYVLRDLDHAIRHLPKWGKPRKVRTPLAAKPGKSSIIPEPLGVVLIMGPWNYPFQLLLSPLISALAAGNCTVLKPSEFAPNTAVAVAELCAEALPDELLAVIQGDAELATNLVDLPFDHIFFTGSTATGRKVAMAASRNLTPVTLELGGKSPCVVCADADIEIAAKRLMWGKCMNAGQTCVAPDYLLADENIHDELLQRLKHYAESFASGGEENRIINRTHFTRLKNLLDNGRIYSGGECDEENLMIQPTILVELDMDSPAMTEEIFGPILPVLTFKNFDSALEQITARPAPLAAYLFSSDRGRIESFKERIKTGSICINDTMSQLLPAELPFGGVGQSGQGRYHGKAGFETFSNLKSIFTKGLHPDPKLRYPPYKTSLETLKKFYRRMMK